MPLNQAVAIVSAIAAAAGASFVAFVIGRSDACVQAGNTGCVRTAEQAFADGLPWNGLLLMLPVCIAIAKRARRRLRELGLTTRSDSRLLRRGPAASFLCVLACVVLFWAGGIFFLPAALLMLIATALPR